MGRARRVRESVQRVRGDRVQMAGRTVVVDFVVAVRIIGLHAIDSMRYSNLGKSDAPVMEARGERARAFTGGVSAWVRVIPSSISARHLQMNPRQCMGGLEF